MSVAVNGDNHVRLTGTVVETPRSRRSPAGVRITRLLMEHGSAQREADVPRSIRFRIGVRAAGGEVAETAARLDAGDRVRVDGFLARLRLQPEDNRLIVSARRIERLADLPAQD